METTRSRVGELMRVLVLAVVVAVPVQSLQAQASGTAPVMQRAVGAEPLWPGDAIRLTFWREPNLNGEYPVDENGRVILPILGARVVTGVTPSDLVDGLLDAYDRELANQEVGITLLRRVRILGAVTTPGLYHVDPTMTFADALALAGGARREGKLNSIRIFRDGQEYRSNLNVETVLVEQIRSGDQIFVPERSWLSRNSTVVVGGLLSAAALIVARAAFTSNN